MVTTKALLKKNLVNLESTSLFSRGFVAFIDSRLNSTGRVLQKHGFHLFSKRIPIAKGKIQSVLKEKIDSEIIKKKLRKSIWVWNIGYLLICIIIIKLRLEILNLLP